MPLTVLLAESVVNAPPAGAVPPIAGGDARYVENPVPLTVLLAARVVNAPVEGVVLPTGPGAAKVAPPNCEAFRFGTTVVLATLSGAVPVVTFDISCVPVTVVVAAIDPGAMTVEGRDATAAPVVGDTAT